MKMRNLLLGVILGLLAVVHSTPVDTIPAKTDEDVLREALTDGFILDHVSPSASPKGNSTVHASQQPPSEPTETESEGSDEGETLVIDESTSPVHPQEGGENFATTQSSTSAVLPGDADASGSHSSTTQSPQSSSTSSAVPNQGQPNVTPDHIAVSQTTDPAVSTSQSSDLWSGQDEIPGQYLTTTSSTTSGFNAQTSTTSPSASVAVFISDSDEAGSGMAETDESPTEMTHENEAGSSTTSGFNMQTSTTSSSTSMAIFNSESDESGSGSGSGMEEPFRPKTRFFHPSINASPTEMTHENEAGSSTTSSPNTASSAAPPVVDEVLESSSTLKTASEKESVKQNKLPISEPQSKGHTTPGWIIIVGFIVGVAALVMLCLAIATRDKWNGPSKPSQLEAQTNSSNQQRELEMETFLHKETPRENGKAAEYTVIPLDELPETRS